ncbi:MAG TPA: hypothetical protein VL225_04385 [Vicinamibacterales bacterium]|nr:hypothetical protein [Vicinamibacterales bacterium]
MMNGFSTARWWGLCLCAAAAAAAGCSKGAAPPAESSAAPAVQAGANGEKYPAPRWPSYFKTPKSVDDLMPAARLLVRNQSGLQGKGMGILKAGDKVLIVAADEADPMVMDAVKKALEERQITPYIKYTYEMRGVTKEAAKADRERRLGGQDIKEAGIYQATAWITGQFPNPSEPAKWLKDKDPQTFAALFPGRSAEAVLTSGPQKPRGEAGAGAGADADTGMVDSGGAGGSGASRGGAGRSAGGRRAGGKTVAKADAKSGAAADGKGKGGDYTRRFAVGDAIKDFLTQHPDVRGVFWGKGGSTGLRRQLYPLQDKFLGTFIQDNVYDLESQMSTYPGDVWQLAEEQLLEPLVYVDRVEITDPEGTNLYADITEEMAQRWAAGAYQRGHLYMFPNQATGRFGYSFVNYPAFQAKWLPREPIARIEGVLAGTQGHGGFFPRWEIFFKNGFISDVKGGGAQGAALKEFLQYPGLNELTFPYHNQPGFWYLYEIAFGSHPKSFRHPGVMAETGNTSPERVRSGVIHWGLGIRLWHDPDAPTESKKWREFTEAHNFPFDHGWHTQTYFTTYKVRLRNANKWVNILDKGHMTSLDNPEVRALASRYGDPNYLLTEDWVPEVPGINAPGDYMKDYAPNPGDYAFKVMEKANAGTYDHYFPGAGAQITYGGQPGTAPAKPAKTSGGGGK